MATHRASSCLSGPLTTHLRRIAERQPDRQLAFVVTLQPGAKAEKLLPFAPAAAPGPTRVVAGSMTASQALKLADDVRVERIELDDPAHGPPPGDDEPND